MSQNDEIIDTGPYSTHEVVRHYRFVSALLGRAVPPEPPRIAWRDHASPLEAGAPYVVLNPGSNEPARRWPLESYLSVAERVLDRGFRVVFVGGADERPESPELAELTARPAVVDLIGRTSLAALMDLMRSASAVLSNDSGPAHLSIALGTPTVVVVGGGHFGSFVPYPADVTPANARFVYQSMECYHCFWRCHKRASKFEVFPCISAVGAEQVWDALAHVLAAGADDRGPGVRAAARDAP